MRPVLHLPFGLDLWRGKALGEWIVDFSEQERLLFIQDIRRKAWYSRNPLTADELWKLLADEELYILKGRKERRP